MIDRNKSVFTPESIVLFCCWKQTKHEAQADGIYSVGVLIFLWVWIRGNYRFQGSCVILGPVYRVCLRYVRTLGQNFTEREHIDVCCENVKPRILFMSGEKFWPLESLNIYKMGRNGKVVFVAEVLAWRVVFEGGINIRNSTIAVLLYNPTNQFRTS